MVDNIVPSTIKMYFFQDSSDHKGHLNMHKFSELFQGRMELTDDLKKFLLALFRAFDENEDSVLDIIEFIQVIIYIFIYDR